MLNSQQTLEVRTFEVHYILNNDGKETDYLNHDQGYQFWTKTDADGSFSIEHVRIGDYNLYAWVPGFIGDYRYDAIISVSAGFTSLSKLFAFVYSHH